MVVQCATSFVQQKLKLNQSSLRDVSPQCKRNADSFGPELQGGLSLDLRLERKLLRGRMVVDKRSIPTLGSPVCEPFLARV